MSGVIKHLACVKRVLQLQILLALSVVAGAYLWHCNIHDVYSSVIGVVIAILPTIVYVRIAFKGGLITSPGMALQKHKKAFVVRFLLNLLLFLMVFLFYPQGNFLILFMSYIMVLGAYWLSLTKN